MANLLRSGGQRSDGSILLLAYRTRTVKLRAQIFLLCRESLFVARAIRNTRNPQSSLRLTKTATHEVCALTLREA